MLLVVESAFLKPCSMKVLYTLTGLRDLSPVSRGPRVQVVFRVGRDALVLFFTRKTARTLKSHPPNASSEPDIRHSRLFPQCQVPPLWLAYAL